MSGKTDSGPINKHQNTGPTDKKTLPYALHKFSYCKKKKNKNSFSILKLKVLCRQFLTLHSQYFGYTQAVYLLCKLMHNPNDHFLISGIGELFYSVTG